MHSELGLQQFEKISYFILIKDNIITFDSLLVLPLTTGTPETLTLLVSVLVVTGDDMVSVLAETQSSPFKDPTYGECLIPKDLDGMECNCSKA